MIENANAGATRPRAGTLGRFASEPTFTPENDVNYGTTSYGGGEIRTTPDYVGPDVDVPTYLPVKSDANEGATVFQTLTPPVTPTNTATADSAPAIDVAKMVASTTKETPLPAAPSTIPWLLLGAIAVTTYLVVKSPAPQGLGSLEPVSEPLTMGRPPRKPAPKAKAKKRVEEMTIS